MLIFFCKVCFDNINCARKNVNMSLQCLIRMHWREQANEMHCNMMLWFITYSTETVAYANRNLPFFLILVQNLCSSYRNKCEQICLYMYTNIPICIDTLPILTLHIIILFGGIVELLFTKARLDRVIVNFNHYKTGYRNLDYVCVSFLLKLLLGRQNRKHKTACYPETRVMFCCFVLNFT